MKARILFTTLFAVTTLLTQIGGAARTADRTDRAGPRLERTTRLPDYTHRLDRRLAWPAFPVRVYFEPDENYTRRREYYALDGFDRWVDATEGIVGYTVVDSPSGAEIFVRFDPETDDGRTQTTFSRSRIRSAEIVIGVRRGSGRDLEATAAHELGHALGLSGHSDDRSDLMYPVHRMGEVCRITERDLNTLAAVYPELDRQRSASTLPRNSVERANTWPVR